MRVLRVMPAKAPQSAPQREAGAETANALADARRSSGGLEKRAYAVPASMTLMSNGALTCKTVNLPREPFEVPPA